MTKIQTPAGSIDILETDEKIFKQLQEYLTFGIVSIRQQNNENNFAIITRCGDKDVYCLKQQPVEIERKAAEKLFHLQHVLIVDAYSRYIKLGFSGAYLATPYFRQRENELWEAGIAHFIFPSGNETVNSEKSTIKTYDKEFGKGATDMFLGFMNCFNQAVKEAKLNMPPYIGIDVRPRTHFQNLAMYFMALGSEIICTRANLREKEDVAWAILSKAGIDKVYHMPSSPMSINESDLNIAKGRSN